MTEDIELYPVSTEPAQAAVVTIEASEDASTAHVGLLYHSSVDETRKHLHLAWHERLRNDPAEPDRAFWIEPRLAEDELEAVADSAHLIATRHRDGRIPYAFDPADARFGSDGMLQLGRSRGLTCATFVMLVFEYMGILLLDRATWENPPEARQREDAAVQRFLHERLRRNPAHRAHADLVNHEVGTARFRAEEVAAASGMAGHPIPFARAEPAGRRVLARLRGQRAA